MAHPHDSNNLHDHSSRKAFQLPIQLRIRSKRVAKIQKFAHPLIRIATRGLCKVSASTKKANHFIKDLFTSQHPEIKRLDIPKLSPVPNLLTSNIAPSSSEIEDIKHAIFQANQRREQFLLDTTLHPTIQSRQLDKTESFIRRHHAILSSVRHLPAEVLQTIFLCFVSDQPPLLGQDPRWAFAQVCCFWRDAALSLTSQWAILPVVKLTTNAHKGVKSTIKVLAEYVRRSASTPLSVTVLEEDDTIDDIGDINHPLLMFLTSHSRRWRRLSLTATTITMASLEVISGNLPVLEMLELVVVGRGSSQEISVFQRAPKLRKANIMSTAVMYPGHIHLPYSQLTNLRTSFPESILAHLWLASGQFLDVPSASLPLLTVLSLRSVSTIYQNLLGALDLPALEELLISYCHMRVCPTILSIIARSRGPCRLRKIYLRFGSSWERQSCGDLPSLLALTQSLDTLDVEILYPEDLLALSSVFPDSVLVPKLTRCTLYVSQLMPDDHDMRRAVSEFVLSRCQPFNNPSSSYVQVQMLSLCTGSATHLRSTGPDQVRDQNLQQGMFDEWSRLHVNVETKFDEFKWIILSNMPRAFVDHQETLVIPRHTQFTNPEWRKSILTTLTDIAQFPVCNAVDIVRSNLHHCLKQLKTLFLTDPVAFSFHLAQISKIYEMWEGSFEDVLNNLHWAFDKKSFEAQVLVYIPQNHPIRLLKRITTSLFMQGYCKADAPDLLGDINVGWEF